MLTDRLHRRDDVRQARRQEQAILLRLLGDRRVVQHLLGAVPHRLAVHGHVRLHRRQLGRAGVLRRLHGGVDLIRVEHVLHHEEGAAMYL